MPENQQIQNDVFLSYNSKDNLLVRELKRQLVAKGLSVWLDEDELRPGVPWQELLEIGIQNSKSVVVVVGQDGLGPWENEEMQAALILAVRNGRPVIPVLMSGAKTQPKMPMFLGNRTWVNLGTDLNDDTVGRLVWGITGAKPKPSSAIPKPTKSEEHTGRRVICKLSCLEKISDTLHGRNISFLRTLCDKFPRTEFRLSKEDGAFDPLGKPADMRSIMDMMLSAFQDGDTVILDVTGTLEVMASTFLKIALENLAGYSDDPVSTTAKISRLIDEASTHLYDPDLADLDDVIVRPPRVDTISVEQEYRAIAVINDRLHDVSLPMIPLITRHFGCDLSIGFELPEKGIFFFSIGPENSYILEKRILDLDIQVGTNITIVTSGTRGDEACSAVKNVLQNLWQCDHWIRRRAKDWDSEAAVFDLIKYAREMARLYNPAYGHVQNPFISNLITQSVFVNATGQPFSKRSALEQLAAPHARLYELPPGEILKRVEEVDRNQTVVPRPGFAIAHAAMDRSPRISISFGVYPGGVLWSKEDGAVQLVAMVICAHDTYKTWRDYLKRFSILFRSLPNLQSQLLSTKTASEFVNVLRAAETSLAKV
jgi:phosphotransferase system HPr-like phosphotransfer protein/mannitol/fructose-specific phosphotransferase system IIA component (Ntr-type)